MPGRWSDFADSPAFYDYLGEIDALDDRHGPNSRLLRLEGDAAGRLLVA
jgi:hypothetical protein